MSNLQMERPEALLGKTVADRYQLLEIIGQGGIGVVYKAKHIHMDRMVAFKMLRSESLKDERNRQRFQQEAKAVSSLNHPNIVSVFDFGFTADNAAYLVMDFLDGKDLDTLIQEHGYLTPEEVVPIFSQICDALAQMHEAGIIHRDLKPGNIIILKKDKKTVAKLVDFGMVKLFDAQSSKQAQSLTQPGEVFGSPYYMSPEQCTGMKLDPRTDIYSMGVLMYEAVTGRPPFLADNMASMAQMHLYEKPQAIGEIINDKDFPVWMQNIIFKSLEKNVNDRYQSTAEMRDALLAFNKFWLEKTGGESKPISLRQTTTSRHVKEELVAAVRLAAAKQAEAKAAAAATAAGPTVPSSAEAQQVKVESAKQASLLSKPIVLIGGGTLLGACIAAAAIFMFMPKPGEAPQDSKRWQDLDENGHYALVTGNLSEAESDFMQALKMAERNGDKDNPDLNKSMMGLAEVYEKQQHYETAEGLYNQVLSRIEKAEGTNSPYLAPVLLKLGSLYNKSKKSEEAEAIHKRALLIQETAFGHEDERLVDYLKEFAETKRKLGKNDDAKIMEERAAKIQKTSKPKGGAEGK